MELTYQSPLMPASYTAISAEAVPFRSVLTSSNFTPRTSSLPL